jgi:hypothetical protein
MGASVLFLGVKRPGREIPWLRMTGVNLYFSCPAFMSWTWTDLPSYPAGMHVMYSAFVKSRCTWLRYVDWLNGFRPVSTLVDITSNTTYKCTATSRTHCTITIYYFDSIMEFSVMRMNSFRDVINSCTGAVQSETGTSPMCRRPTAV